MNIEQIDKINHAYHTILGHEQTPADIDLLEHLRSIEVEQPLTTHQEQQIADLYNKYGLEQ